VQVLIWQRSNPGLIRFMMHSEINGIKMKDRHTWCKIISGEEYLHSSSTTLTETLLLHGKNVEDIDVLVILGLS
jgi:hypothetical protein